MPLRFDLGRNTAPFRFSLLVFIVNLVAAAPANIVFIFVDDLGVDWLSCYGSDHSTPHIDRLAKTGVRFATAWTSPICTPSRVCMLTGLYNGRTGWTEHYDVPRWGGDGLIAERFATWPQILQQRGYTTAIVGKWQINDLRKSPDVLRAHGFDFHCVWPGVESGNPLTERRYWDPFLQIDGQRSVHKGTWGPEIVHSYALEFIRQHKAGPFLLYYPMIEVHEPHEATPLNRDNPPSDQTALYADAVTQMDAYVGAILDELDRLGIVENTLVVFAGDNGSPIGGSMGGTKVQAGKGRMTNRGVQIPLIVRAPMWTRGGWLAGQLADTSDVFPTMLDAGEVSRAGYPVDGISWAPLLRVESSYVPRRWIYAQRDEVRAVRDQQFKLDSTGAFFDLADDPDERAPLVPSDVKSRRAHDDLSAVLRAIPGNAPTPPFAGYTPVQMRRAEAARGAP